MATQQSALYSHWRVKFYQAMHLVAELQLELATPSAGGRPPNTDPLTESIQEIEGFYNRFDHLEKEEQSKVCRQGLELAADLRPLATMLELRPGDPVFEKWDEFADRTETLALGVDPEIARSLDQTRIEARRGLTQSLEDNRRELGL